MYLWFDRHKNKQMQKIVVAITGASGSIYAKQLLKKLTGLTIQVEEIAVVMSTNADVVWQTEIGDDSYKQLPVTFYDKMDFMSPIASGSSQFNSMVIVPCSMGTLARIANGMSNDLITRAADVMLKERRRLICVPRETPYNLIHLQNMEKLTLAGGIICPASPSFYSRPQTIEELVNTVVDRVIDLMGIKQETYRWGLK